ncbi:MAG: ABC transporter substrate-binding protein [Acidimicrobiales bacterium]
MIRRTAIWLALFSALTLVLAGWTSVTGRPASFGPRAKTSVITLENNTGQSFTRNFNLFDASSLSQGMSIRTLTNEPLFEYDTLRPGVVHDWLATSYKFSDGGKTLTFGLRKGVYWSDGKPFTSADVAFTFNLMNNNAAANYSGIPPFARGATTSGKYSVSLHFKAAAYSDLYSIAGTTYIVPQHIWKSIKNPATATVATPIGTGPYVLKSFNTTLVTFRANRHYWGGRVPISQVDVPSYNSNSSASTALSSGQLDWAGNDIPSIRSVFTDKSSHNHYFFAPGSTVTLYFNVAKGGPLANPKVRQAISYGINRDQLSSEGETGYEAPATSSSGLILPAQSQFLTKANTRDLPGRGDPSKVAAILRSAGYKKVNGYWEKNGQKISFSIEDPIAYSDYYADAQLISNSLKRDGIDATVDGVSTSQWYSDLPSGNFQTAIHWGAGGVSPFVQYQNWMDSTLSAPLGKSATADYGRYHNATAEAALKRFESTNPANTKALTADIHTLASIMSTQVPDAPLLYGADWDEFSTARFTGFPNAANPYMDPSPSDPELGYILMHLKVVR